MSLSAARRTRTSLCLHSMAGGLFHSSTAEERRGWGTSIILLSLSYGHCACNGTRQNGGAARRKVSWRRGHGKRSRYLSCQHGSYRDTDIYSPHAATRPRYNPLWQPPPPLPPPHLRHLTTRVSGLRFRAAWMEHMPTTGEGETACTPAAHAAGAVAAIAFVDTVKHYLAFRLFAVPLGLRGRCHGRALVLPGGSLPASYAAGAYAALPPPLPRFWFDSIYRQRRVRCLIPSSLLPLTTRGTI